MDIVHGEREGQTSCDKMIFVDDGTPGDAVGVVSAELANLDTTSEYKMSENAFDEFAFTEVMAVYLDDEGANLGQNYARKRPAFHRTMAFSREFAAEYAARLAAYGPQLIRKCGKVTE